MNLFVTWLRAHRCRIAAVGQPNFETTLDVGNFLCVDECNSEAETAIATRYGCFFLNIALSVGA